MSENMSGMSKVENSRVTWEGCSVLLDINDGDRLVFARLTAGSSLKIGNKNYSLQPLIGCPFGSLFQVESGSQGAHLSHVTPSAEEGNIQGNGTCQPQDECRDNRAIVDNNKAQSLTSDDIEALRSQGATGNEIIAALIANSATFEKKTAFSQEKYRLKKQKKYAPKVLLRRPFSRSICETYFKKNPSKIGFLRVDTLSLLLSMGNVGAGSDILVVDMVGGLLTGAVAERLGGSGYVCNTYVGDTPSAMDIVRIFNFSDEICERIVRSSLSLLCSSDEDTSQQSGHCGDTCNAEASAVEQLPSDDLLPQEHPPSTEKEMQDVATEVTVSSVVKPCNSSKATKAGEKAPKEMIDSWRSKAFTSLIIAAPEEDPWTIVKSLLPILAYSAPFAIYHQYLQPLAVCMHNLQLEKLATGMQISEPWLREYQVLPSRTHPCMQMSASGGYILSGTRLYSSSSST